MLGHEVNGLYQYINLRTLPDKAGAPISETNRFSSSPSTLSRANKATLQTSCPSYLSPQFRSSEAYIEHCMTKCGPEGVPESALDRMCVKCTEFFKIDDEIPEGDTKWSKKAPFCSVDEFLKSASEGNCHVCHRLMAHILDSDESTINFQMIDLTAQATNALLRMFQTGDESHSGDHDEVEMGTELGINGLRQGEASLTLELKLDGSGMDDEQREWQGFVLVTVSENDGKQARVGCLRIYLRDENHDMLSLGRGFPTALSTVGDASWKQALKWMENCRSHTLCKAAQNPNSQVIWPARLIAVGITGETHVRICETKEPGFVEEPYLTLSHCWGTKGVPTRLLTENYATFLNGFQLSQLPKTFRDAIEITRRMNFRFIWIDSLCIIQNSPGDEDWVQESAKMHQVYRNSALNLAAGASSDSSGGLFYRRYPLSLAPFSIPFGNNRFLMDDYKSEHTNMPRDGLILYTRGWVFQEQLLPRRTLIFGRKELHWECTTCEANETFPVSVERSDRDRTIFRPDWEILVEGKLVDSERKRAWDRMVMTYFTRSLTKPSDRLVAISGLAQQLGSIWSGMTYHAGLWSYRLVQSLLWHPLGPCTERITEIAPSWSWASLNQKSESAELWADSTTEFIDALAEVLEAKTRPKAEANPFGSVACGGTIRLRSPVLRVKVTAADDGFMMSDMTLKDRLDLDALILKDLSISWDIVSDVKAEVEEVYLAPFQVQANDVVRSVKLHGLVLFRTATQLRRAGVFWVHDESHDTYLSSEDDFDSGSNSRSGGNDKGIVSSDTGNAAPRKVDRSDYMYRLGRWRRNIERLKKKGFFPDVDAWFNERAGAGVEERAGYLRKDPTSLVSQSSCALSPRWPNTTWQTTLRTLCSEREKGTDSTLTRLFEG
ncbi:putative heterokaryon incompatibility protein [Sordaria brevicollis]|uniref:Heterokaryon incompatibility protein n=1 Tax=Sordaria brevicollis TaxID=83679 RepID=A0AAE0P306_SORBR|nr:putative heterokaryon incompatibility protein [Sordaria brevicollis]